ncbi:arad-like aldolase/epimerase [Periconia macrospinosa]|uniref:Arad-like aldolase/epimerase n=1 Tax=Periconia macrospinosa TaxID=97972 RepID=A0A2V1DE42_9PLEO|nr:arad-like aldolase/epimerase [Periconia macrospinosa]
MVNITATLSALITANHVLDYLNVLDPFGHISVRNPNNNSTFFIALQMGAAIVSGPKDIGEYLIEDGSGVNGTTGGYAERYIHSEILKRYPDVNAVVHSHSEDILPYTIVESVSVEPTYHMAGFLGDQVPNFDIETVYEVNDPRDMLVNSPRLGAALASVLGTNTSQPTSPLYTTALQRGHGFITTGTSIEQVVEFAYYATSNARVQTGALGLSAYAGLGTGGVKYLSSDERKNSKDMNIWISFKVSMLTKKN